MIYSLYLRLCASAAILADVCNDDSIHGAPTKRTIMKQHNSRGFVTEPVVVHLIHDDPESGLPGKVPPMEAPELFQFRRKQSKSTYVHVLDKLLSECYKSLNKRKLCTYFLEETVRY